MEVPPQSSPTPGGGPAPGPNRPKRRPRYAGKHPRRFDEKYKEHNPTRYAQDIDKVLSSGKTPAGTHRPILVAEILDRLALTPGGIAVDATLGYGGHARALLERLAPGGRLIGLDVDPVEQPKTVARIRQAGYGETEFTPVQSNFAGLPQVLAELGVAAADAILADLGVSSMQLDDPSRGFTFKDDGPLDLRLNPQRPPSAAQLLATIRGDKLAAILTENADEPHARVLAEGLLAARDRKPLGRTRALAEAVRETLRQHRLARDRETENACVRRVFQALRIAVNDEFGALDAFLRALPWCLKPGGRACILTFHSGEDRRVKQSFLAGRRDGTYSSVADEVVRPSPEEQRSNPRSSPAKLRWAIRAS